MPRHIPRGSPRAGTCLGVASRATDSNGGRGSRIEGDFQCRFPVGSALEAPAFIPCFDDAAVSATRRVKLSIRRSMHWLARTPISISTMFNQLACLGT